MSRQYGLNIDGEEKQCYIPFADLINHAQEYKVNAEWMYNDGEDGFIVRATDDIKIGEQIHISYGTDKTNQDLFLNYAFVLDENIENDIVMLALELDREYGHYTEKYEALSQDWHS